MLIPQSREKHPQYLIQNTLIQILLPRLRDQNDVP